MNFPCAMTHALNTHLAQLDEEEAYLDACEREAKWIIELTGEDFMEQFSGLEDDFIEAAIELLKTMTLQELFDLEEKKVRAARHQGIALSSLIAHCIDYAADMQVEKERSIDCY